jgi:hypothetical protein
MAACGFSHTLVVTQDGGLWACGSGYDRQLGLNDEAARHAFERVGTEAFGGARVVTTAAGWQHSVAVTEDGTLWIWGLRNRDRLGPTKVPKTGPGQTLVGRWHAISEEMTLALAMSQHMRLGAQSEARMLSPEILDFILKMSGNFPVIDPVKFHGLFMLMGGQYFSNRSVCKSCSNRLFRPSKILK